MALEVSVHKHLALWVVAKRYITGGCLEEEEATHFLVDRKQREIGRGLDPKIFFKGTPIFFLKAPPLKGPSSTAGWGPVL